MFMSEINRSAPHDKCWNDFDMETVMHCARKKYCDANILFTSQFKRGTPANSTSMENIKSWAMEQNMQHKIEVLTKRRFSKLFWSINLWTNVFWTNFSYLFFYFGFFVQVQNYSRISIQHVHRQVIGIHFRW